jgi:predicted phosphoribosyltransferase
MPDVQPLYPTRSGAGSQLGQTIYRRASPPAMVLGVTPTGVEVAANAAQAMGAQFDVIVTAQVRLDDVGIVGAVAEDADAVLDPEFEPRFATMEKLRDAIDQARRTVKTERLLFRGQRPLRSVEGMHVIILDGHATSPWNLLAAADAVHAMGPRRVVLGAAVGTQPVQERIRARRFEFVCPSVVMDPQGHPKPFGDPQDPSAERLRSIVIAREAA